MSFFRRILGRNKATANVAKERLQIIISHERSKRNERPDFLPSLQQEIVDVIAKYIPIDKEQVKIQLDQSGDNAVLELNVIMPDGKLLEEAATH